MREHTIASHFVRAALRGVARQGLDGPVLLRHVGIQPALLDEPRARIALEQFIRLMQLLWEVLDDEYMGFGEVRSKRGTFTMMCHTLIHCRTLEKALQHDELFYGLFPQAPLIHLRRDGDPVRLSLEERHLSDLDHFLAENLLVIWHHLAGWLIGQRIRLEEATFSYPAPGRQAEYGLLFPYPRRLSTGCTSLLLAARYLGMSLPRDERTLKQFLQHPPADLLACPDGGDSLTSQIRRPLGRDCRRWPDLDQVARQLHMSSQTLRRHLREEDSSFQQPKDYLRRDLTTYHLGRDELSIQNIAEQFGFSEPSASHRTFEKWTGLTPGVHWHQAEA